MSARTRAAVGVWRARRSRTPGDRAFAVYLFVAVSLVTVAPLVRTVWVVATGPDGVALFGAPAAPAVTALLVTALWAGALLVGRDRGPALHPPALTYVLGASDLRRSDAFRRPLLRALTAVTTLTTLSATVVGASLTVHGRADPVDALTFAAAGALVGVVTAVCWLAGQALPRAAALLAAGVGGLGAVAAAVPSGARFSPAGWVSLVYPGTGSPPAIAALAALAVALLAVIPALMHRLTLAALTAQSLRWDAATVHAGGMDLTSAGALYRARPLGGRRLRAVRGTGRLPLTVLRRDAVGALRTPTRLLVGTASIALAGWLFGIAYVPTSPDAGIAALAGMVLFAGLGPLSDGIRHAANVSGDLPLYGISDGRLLAQHLLFPLGVVLLVLCAAVLATALVSGIGVGAPLAGAAVLGSLTLAARVSDALKGALPPVLLTPIPTAMGDLGAAVRLVWAIDAVLLSAAAGAAAALVAPTPVLLLGVGGAVIGLGVGRWRHRR